MLGMFVSMLLLVNLMRCQVAMSGCWSNRLYYMLQRSPAVTGKLRKVYEVNYGQVMSISRVRAAANDEARFSKGTAALSDSLPALFKLSLTPIPVCNGVSLFRNKGGNRNYPRLLFRNKAPYSGLRSGRQAAKISTQLRKNVTEIALTVDL